MHALTLTWTCSSSSAAMIEPQDGLMGLAWDVADELSLPYAPSPHVMSESHFQRLLDLERRLAHDILSEGVEV